MEFKQDIKTIFNLKEIEKMKQKSEYVKTNNLWKKLSQEQKQFIINKYIDEIEIDVDKDYNVSIANIVFNKNEQEKNDYVYNLRNFYNIKETTIQADSFDINSFNTDDVIQIIPREKKSKFDKNIFTILQIEV